MNCYFEILNADKEGKKKTRKKEKKREKRKRKKKLKSEKKPNRFIFNFSCITPCLVIRNLSGKMKYQSKPPSPTNTCDMAEHS